MTTKPIAGQYAPEDVIGEFGWLWFQPMGYAEKDWTLIRTIIDYDHGDSLAFIAFASDGDQDVQDVWHAETHRGTPYFPIFQPKCLPGAGAMVCVWLGGGATMTVSHEDCSAEAQALTDRVLAVMRGEG